MSEPLIRVQNLVKNYSALRPLRIARLEVQRGSITSLVGLDASAAEMLVALLTGAVLPEQGEIHLLGESTAHVTDADAWLAMLDQVGVLTDRAVLIAQFSVEQNIAMPFTLQVDPLAEHMRSQVAALAAEVGLSPGDLSTPVAGASPAVVARVRLARALALNPVVLLAEHPSASLPRDAVNRFADDVTRIARARQMAVLAVTADEVFANALGGDLLTHEPATGALRPRRSWRKLFG